MKKMPSKSGKKRRIVDDSSGDSTSEDELTAVEHELLKKNRKKMLKKKIERLITKPDGTNATECTSEYYLEGKKKMLPLPPILSGKEIMGPQINNRVKIAKEDLPNKTLFMIPSFRHIQTDRFDFLTADAEVLYQQNDKGEFVEPMSLKDDKNNPITQNCTFSAPSSIVNALKSGQLVVTSERPCIVGVLEVEDRFHEYNMYLKSVNMIFFVRIYHEFSEGLKEELSKNVHNGPEMKKMWSEYIAASDKNKINNLIYIKNRKDKDVRESNTSSASLIEEGLN